MLLSFIFYIYPRVLSSWLILFICWLIHVVGINCIIILGCKKFSVYRHLLNALLLPAHPKKKEEKRRELCWTSCLIKCLSKFMYKHMQPCLLTCCQLIKLIKTFKNCFRSLHNAAIGDLFAIMRKGFGCWCIYALSKFYTLYKMIYLLNFMHKIVSCFNCLGFFIIYLFYAQDC